MSVLRQIKTDWLSRGVPAALLLVIVAGQPWLDLDSWIYPFLDRYGLPRPSTIIRYLVVPALILWCFYRFDRHRGRTLAVGGVSAAVLTVYFFFHHQLAAQAAGLLNLTENFRYSLFQEAMYCLTLLLPYGLIYFFVHVRFAPRVFRQVCAVLSASVSLPIVISDLFVFGQSTYLGMTQANFLSWFSGLGETVEPRQLSCKFFFIEGNTIGIALFMLLPLLYFYFADSQGRKEKLGWGALIVTQSLAMLMLSTRVAALGTVLIPAVFAVIVLLDALALRHGSVNKAVLALCAGVGLSCLVILPFTPAIGNQRVDAQSNELLKEQDALLQRGIEQYRQRLQMDPDSPAYRQFCLDLFEQYGIEYRLISSLPQMYYLDWYSYRQDPVFWSDLLFNVELEQRMDGRQFQRYFMNVKWDQAPAMMKLTGMGYTPLMNGSILLEQDFFQQKYTLGYLGAALMCGPWVILTLGGAVLVLVRWKRCLTLSVMSMAMALCCGLFAAVFSGHTLDQFITTMLMAMLCAELLKQVVFQKEKGENA